MTASATGLFDATRRKRREDPAQPLLLDAPKVKRPKPPRRNNDYYPTAETDAARALLVYDGDKIHAAGSIWDPACGAGHQVRIWRETGLPCTASDLVDRGCPDSWQADYFTCLKSRAGAIITNPPYNLITARDGKGAWLRHTMEMPGWSYCAFLLDWNWPAARSNGFARLMQTYPFSYAYLMRWKLDFTGQGQPPGRHAWFVWIKDWEGTPMQLRFMDRIDGRQSDFNLEEDEDDQ